MYVVAEFYYMYILTWVWRMNLEAKYIMHVYNYILIAIYVLYYNYIHKLVGEHSTAGWPCSHIAICTSSYPLQRQTNCTTITSINFILHVHDVLAQPACGMLTAPNTIVDISFTVFVNLRFHVGIHGLTDCLWRHCWTLLNQSMNMIRILMNHSELI